jgi:hypothetical protein
VIVFRWLEGFGKFWWDFLIGDDWSISAVVVVSIAGAYGLERAGVAAWWLVPAAAMTIVCVTLWRRSRQ